MHAKWTMLTFPRLYQHLYLSLRRETLGDHVLACQRPSLCCWNLLHGANSFPALDMNLVPLKLTAISAFINKKRKALQCYLSLYKPCDTHFKKSPKALARWGFPDQSRPWHGVRTGHWVPWTVLISSLQRVQATGPRHQLLTQINTHCTSAAQKNCLFKWKFRFFNIAAWLNG